MKKMTTVLALAALFGSASAFAFQCPSDVKKIDAAMAENMSMSASQMAKVKKLRDSGAAHHKAGEHQQALDELAQAMKMMGMM
ncbi:MAG: hypothetical protein BMS9Abin01_0470 [Gammaproteobacteria bacterium]|nr:MAG: hypothetical protein BMS9Abin01_0470 [Gammaproteobacteria bacterium]